MNGSQHDFVGAAFVRAQIAAAKREGCRPHGAIVSRGLPRSNAVRTFLQKSKEMAPQANDANACAKKRNGGPGGGRRNGAAVGNQDESKRGGRPQVTRSCKSAATLGVWT